MSTVTNTPVVEATKTVSKKSGGAISRALAGVKKLYSPRHAKVSLTALESKLVDVCVWRAGTCRSVGMLPLYSVVFS